jgi:hypothetical protein
MALETRPADPGGADYLVDCWNPVDRWCGAQQLTGLSGCAAAVSCEASCGCFRRRPGPDVNAGGGWRRRPAPANPWHLESDVPSQHRRAAAAPQPARPRFAIRTALRHPGPLAHGLSAWWCAGSRSGLGGGGGGEVLAGRGQAAWAGGCSGCSMGVVGRRRRAWAWGQGVGWVVTAAVSRLGGPGVSGGWNRGAGWAVAAAAVGVVRGAVGAGVGHGVGRMVMAVVARFGGPGSRSVVGGCGGRAVGVVGPPPTSVGPRTGWG